MFYGGEKPLDDMINEFLAENERSYVDLKLIGVDNTYSTQCSYMAALVYREEDD